MSTGDRAAPIPPSLEIGLMNATFDDFGFSVRALAAQPLFTFTIVLTLALAVGANTAVFSVVYGVLLSELPYEDADNVVRIRLESTQRQGQRSDLAPAEFADLIERSQLIQTAGYFQWGGMSLGGTDRPRDLTSNAVTPEYFEALGVTPRLGPGFSDDPEGEVIISSALWRADFGQRNSIIGRDVILEGKLATVVGVMPEWMSYPSQGVDLWVPAAPIDLGDRSGRDAYLIARVQAGSHAAFEDELAEITTVWQTEFPETNRDWRIAVYPLSRDIVGDADTTLWILMCIVVLVLLIACANVANMMLARGVHRARELALRVALGATRLSLLRLVLVEAAILGISGAFFGLMLAWAAVDAIELISSLGLPRLDAVRINAPVLGFTTILSLATALFFGLLPALKASHTEPLEALKSGGKGVDGANSAILQSSFTVAAVAFAVVLMIVSAILVKSFTQLVNIDPGYDPSGVASVQLWRGGSAAERETYFQSVLEKLRKDGRIESAGVTNWIPMDYIHGQRRQLRILGRADLEGEPAQLVTVMGEALRTLRVKSAGGAPLDSTADLSAERLVWINRTGAQRYFASDQEALNSNILIDARNEDDEELPYRLAGIVDDVRYASLEEAAVPTLYFPRRGLDTVNGTIVARGAGKASDTTALVLDVVWSIDPAQSVYRDFQAEDLLDNEIADERLYLRLVLAFSAIAVVLACVGVFAVLSYTVNRRLGEFGLRAALGATRGRILALVLRESLARLAIGLFLGVALTLAINRWLSSQLFGIASLELSAFGVAVIIVTTVTLMAALGPALRATRSEPIQALRWE